MQHIDFAMQIAKAGTIYDLYAGDKYHYEIMPTKFQSWPEVEKWYMSRFAIISDQLREECNIYRLFVMPEPCVRPGFSLICFLNYLSKR